jgi:hypothetical protein
MDHVDVDGIEFDWPGQLTREQTRKQLEMEIDIGLAVIAAQDRYRFGWVPDHEFIGSWQFNRCQIEDFRLVRDLIAEIDTDDVDLLYRSWCRALEFVNDEAIWSGMELVAETLGRESLSGIQVENLTAAAFWDTSVFTPSAD